MVEVVVDSNVILRALFFGDKYSMIKKKQNTKSASFLTKK